MSTVFSFQTQLVSIMDALSKTAVLEISKLVAIESKMLKIEITRGRNEVTSLTEKLQLMEKLLFIAQAGRTKDAAAGSVVRDASEDPGLQPDRTRPAVQGDGPWESSGSCAELSKWHLFQGEEHAIAELPNPLRETPELIVVKEEPLEVDNGGCEQHRTSENRREAFTETQNSSEGLRCRQPVTERLQPRFTDSFVTTSGQSSPAGPRRREAQWNPQPAMEVQLRAAREAQTYSAHVNNVSRRHPAEQQQPAPSIDGVFGKDWCMDLWREDKHPPQRKETVEPAAMSSMGVRAIDLMESEPDLIFVKEEIYDDHPIGQQMRLPDTRKVVGIFDDDSMLHRPVDELQLHSGQLNGFPMTADGQAQQRAQPTIMDKLIDDATMSTLVDDAHAPSAPAEYSNYASHVHPNAAKEFSAQSKPVKPTKRFECLFCGKIFNYLSSLKVHIRRHSGEKPFSCSVCAKRFAQKTYLKLHQRVHSGEKPYSCADCGKSFSQKSSLNIHLRTHTGEKPYSCVDCGKAYAYKYGLNHHQCFH